MLRASLLGLLVASPLFFLACSANEATTAGADGGTDATTGGDAAAPSEGGPIACAQSLVDYCQKPGDCPDYDTAVTASSPFCGENIDVATGCDGLVAVIVSGIDAAYSYYYDSPSHALVAVTYTMVSNTPMCLAGPASFAVPASCSGSDTPIGCQCPPKDPLDNGGFPPAFPSPSFKTHPPSEACTAQQIDAYYQCMNGSAPAGSCDRFLDGGAADLACAACLQAGDHPDYDPAGALDGERVDPINVAGCIANAEGAAADAGCAAPYAFALDCASDACWPQCFAVPLTDAVDCVRRALAGPCARYVGLATCVADGGPIATACGVDAPPDEQFRRVATRLCGASLVDAGSSDAGDAGAD